MENLENLECRQIPWHKARRHLEAVYAVLRRSYEVRISGRTKMDQRPVDDRAEEMARGRCLVLAVSDEVSYSSSLLQSTGSPIL